MTTVLPHSREAEEAALGSVLINPGSLFEVSYLAPRDFYIHRHQWIWDAFLKLSERRTEIDLVTVADELGRLGQLAEAGGPAYLTTLASQCPTSLNIRSYAGIIQQCSLRRKMVGAASKIANLAVDEEKSADQCLTEARVTLDSVQTLENHRLQTFGELLSETYSEIQVRSQNPKDVWGLATRLPKFDRETGGLHQGELVYLVGAPAVGKTWLELGWALELGKQAPGALFSLEMKKLAIGRRLLSGMSGVSTRSMKSGFVQNGDWPKLQQALDEYSHLPIMIDDSGYDTGQLRAALLWAKQEHGIRWFILDYALLLSDSGRDETEQTKIISANMKRIVNDLNLAGVVIHSVVKVGMSEHDEPNMADQRGSGQAIHDADLQVFLTKVSKSVKATEEQKKKMATLWVSKSREMEQSKFSINLIRQGLSPFWGEYAEGFE